jgi:hypothetical protein
MKLAKALKIKGKKLKEYQTTLSKTISHNSYDVDVTDNRIYNSKELLSKSQDLLNDYIAFKAAIHNTSAPIRSKIFRLGELKFFLDRINDMSTVAGIRKSESYSGTPVINTYKADISETEKNDLIKLLEDEIEEIQDEIDTFNATTDLVGY